MKKIVVSLFFIFCAINAFAVTAQDVHKKSKNLCFVLDKQDSCIREYETSDVSMKQVEILGKNFIDSRHDRFDLTTKTRTSNITVDGKSYSSSEYDANMRFKNYTFVREHSSKSNDTIKQLNEKLDEMFIFDKSAETDKEYVLLLEMGICDFRYWVDKKTYFVNKIETENKEYKNVTICMYSDYRQVEGSGKFYPFYEEVESSNEMIGIKTTAVIKKKTIFFKVLTPQELSPYFDVKNPKVYKLSEKSVFPEENSAISVAQKNTSSTISSTSKPATPVKTQGTNTASSSKPEATSTENMNNSKSSSKSESKKKDNNFGEELGKEASKAAKDETKSQVKKATKKGVSDGFKKVFK